MGQSQRNTGVSSKFSASEDNADERGDGLAPDQRDTQCDLEALRVEAARCRRDFNLVSATFGVVHATVTTPIMFAATVLTNEVGQASDAVLYAMCLVSSLFFATAILGLLDTKKGLALAMLGYTVYVLLFAISSSLCAEFDLQHRCLRGFQLQAPLALIGAGVGGLAAGVMWTCQGVFFVDFSTRISEAELQDPSVITAELASIFASIFLFMEFVMRLLSTLLTKYADLAFSTLFYGYCIVALVTTVVFVTAAPESKMRTQGTVCSKAFDAVKQWRDPKMWLLQCTNVTFGFAASWLAGDVDRNILSVALSASFIGFGGALISGLACVLSRVLGSLALIVGKGPVVTLGALSFLAMGVLSRWVGDPATWGWGAFVFYILMGIGRAVYEGTNKAIFADYYPGEQSPGAFANVFIFGTSASTLAFILGSVKKNYAELLLLLIGAALTAPALWLASLLKRRGQRSSLLTGS